MKAESFESHLDCFFFQIHCDNAKKKLSLSNTSEPNLFAWRSVCAWSEKWTAYFIFSVASKVHPYVMYFPWEWREQYNSLFHKWTVHCVVLRWHFSQSWVPGHWWASVECLGCFVILCHQASLTPIQLHHVVHLPPTSANRWLWKCR